MNNLIMIIGISLIALSLVLPVLLHITIKLIMKNEDYTGYYGTTIEFTENISISAKYFFPLLFLIGSVLFLTHW